MPPFENEYFYYKITIVNSNTHAHKFKKQVLDASLEISDIQI